MLQPKKTKYKKCQKGRLTGKASKNCSLFFGTYGLQALEPAWITARQIEATRRTLSRLLKKIGQIWVKIFPDKPITARATESRMGAGKGSVNLWVAKIKPGNILFELTSSSHEIALYALKIASYKLPIKTKILFKK